MPTPYPTDFYTIDRWFGAGIDAWGTLSDGPVEDRRDVLGRIIDSFDDGVPADLTTLRVMHFTADFAPRDVTEDILMDIGVMLSELHRAEPESYPDAFDAWADTEMQIAINEASDPDHEAQAGYDAAREAA